MAPAPASIFVYGWMLAVVATVIFLAAGPVQGPLGIFLVGTGLVLTFFPARTRVEWPLWLVIGGLLACGSLAFLPARWFPVPSWRVVLSAAADIHLPATVTPLPWETGFWLAILAISCVTGLFLLSHPVRSKTVLGMATAAVTICGIYAALSICAKQTGWHYPFSAGASFGFFPNRNHTATFLVTGSIIALGVLTISLRENRWLLTLFVGASMLSCVVGLFFYSGSRGGVIFLLIGTLIWVAGLGKTHRSLPLTVSLAALTVAAGLLFLISGGEARARLLGRNAPGEGSSQAAAAPVAQQGPGDQEAPADFRVLIYRDTFDLIKDAPVTGMGLGAFAPVFVQYRRASATNSVALHPESDWLMLVAEVGLPALLCVLVIGGLLLTRLRGASAHPYWPLRWGCVVAATAALLHGTVDVPAHRLALGWWILLLAGLGLQVGRGRGERSGAVQRVLFILSGIGSLALGVLLIRAEWYGGRALPPFAAAEAEKVIQATFERGETWAAMEQAQAAVGVSPLAAPLYFQLGFMMLHFQDSDAEVDEAFKAERLLNRTWPYVPLRQGDVLMTVNPVKTAALWLDALDRQTILDHASSAADGAVGFYRSLLDRGRSSPDTQRALIAGIRRGPDFLLTWLDGADAKIVSEQLPLLAAQPAVLGKLDTDQRQKFLLVWYMKGDRADLARFISDNAEWRAAGWLVHLHELIDSKQFEAAVRTAMEHYQVSPAPRSEKVEFASGSASGGDVAKFNAFLSEGNTVAARHALDEPVEDADRSPAALEYWRLKTALAVSDKDWKYAWEVLRRYLHLAHPTEDLP